MARPTKANEEIKNQVLRLIKEGLTIEAIARALNIHKDTIYEWKKKDKQFSDAVDSQKQDTIQNELKKIFTIKDLAKLMKKKASGFKYTEVTRIYDGEENLQQIKKIEKLVPPDSEMIKQVKEILTETESGDSNELTINLIRKEVQKIED